MTTPVKIRSLKVINEEIALIEGIVKRDIEESGLQNPVIESIPSLLKTFSAWVFLRTNYKVSDTVKLSVEFARLVAKGYPPDDVDEFLQERIQKEMVKKDKEDK